MSEVFNADVLDAINRALSAENVVTREGEEPVYCNVNNETREIEIPGEISIFGVEHDENAVRVFFKCPKIIGDNVDIDITRSMVYIIYINAGGEKDQYIVTDVNETEDGNVTFSWLINRKPAKYQGITQFGIRVIKSKTGGEIENEWNTTVANANILNGVETEDIELSGDNIDVVNQFVQLINTTAENTIENINESEENAINAIETQQQQSILEVNNAKNQAINTIEQTGEKVKDSLPDDYTEMSVNVDELLKRISVILKRISVIEILLDNFEFGRELGNYSDLDDCVKSGIYYWGNGIKPINGVANVTPAGLFVLPISDTDVSQIIVSKDKRVYKRYSSDGIWSDFVSIEMSDIFENYYLLLSNGNNITDRNNNKLVARAFMKGE